MRKFLGLLFKPILKIPVLRRLYLKRLLAFIENTPASKLPDELRPVKAALEKLPKGQRLAALETGAKQGPQAEVAQNRSVRRAAERQARRGR